MYNLEITPLLNRFKPYLLFLIFLLALATSFAESIERRGYGFYSGTFDPPTLAHLQIIDCALGEGNVSEECKNIAKNIKQLVISANVAADKDTSASAKERVLMLEGALKKYGDRVKVIASTKEQREKVKNELAEKSVLYQFIGADSFLLLPEEALKQSSNYKYYVMPRESGGPADKVEEEEVALNKKLKNNSDSVKLLPKLNQYNDLSSTMIRARVNENKSLAGFVDSEVESIINKFGIYTFLPPELEILNQSLFKEGFISFLNDVKNSCINLASEQEKRCFKNSESSEESKVKECTSLESILQPQCEELVSYIESKNELKYKSGQSENRFGEKYVEYVLAKIGGKDHPPLKPHPQLKEAMSKYIPRLVISEFQGMPYGKLSHLAPVKIDMESSEAKVSHDNIKELICAAEKSFQNKENYNMDIERYLSDRFPAKLKDFLWEMKKRHKLSDDGVFITDRTLSDALIRNELPLTSSGEKFYFIQTRRGQPHRSLFLGYNPSTGNYRLIATEVSGSDRKANVHCQLKLTGVFNYYHDLSSLKDKDFYQLNEAGNKLKLHEDDILLFGFKAAWIDELLNNSEWQWKRTKLSDSLELSLEMLEIQNSTKKFPRLILARNVFGDFSRKVLEILYDKGLRKTIYLGTAGALIDIPVGSIVLPTEFIGQNFKQYTFNSSWSTELSAALLKDGRPLSQDSRKKHAWVPELFEETISQLTLFRDQGTAASIDIEGIHMARFAQEHQDFKIAIAYVISDQTLGKSTIEESNSQNAVIAMSVHNIIKTILPKILPEL